METQFSCMHTHTLFCDGKDDIETMCRAAYEKKLCALGFSAHAPIYKQTGLKTDWNMNEDRLNEYISQVHAAKRRWQGRLAVYLGLEVDYIKGKRSAQDSDIKELNTDYIIGSLHYLVPLNGADLFTVDGPPDELKKGLNEGFNGDAEALMHCYYDTMTEMIKTGGFDILGHADIIKKNFQNKKFWPAESESVRQMEIARAASESGITVEVNTGGLNQKKTVDVYPSLTFLQHFSELKVPVIITADAHRAEHLDGHYSTALQTIKCAGFSEHFIFFGKNNNKIIWKNVKIQQKVLD